MSEVGGNIGLKPVTVVDASGVWTEAVVEVPPAEDAVDGDPPNIGLKVNSG